MVKKKLEFILSVSSIATKVCTDFDKLYMLHAYIKM